MVKPKAMYSRILFCTPARDELDIYLCPVEAEELISSTVPKAIVFLNEFNIFLLSFWDLTNRFKIILNSSYKQGKIFLKMFVHPYFVKNIFPINISSTGLSILFLFYISSWCINPIIDYMDTARIRWDSHGLGWSKSGQIKDSPQNVHMILIFFVPENK